MTNKIMLLFILGLFVLIGCEEKASNDKELVVNNDKKTTAGVPIEALEINERFIDQKLSLTGILIPINSVEIITEVTGKVKKINKELGDFVKSDETLAVIDDIIPESQYKQAQAQVLSTKSALKISELNLKSDKLLYENNDISELEYNNSQSTYNNAEAQHLSAVAMLSVAKKNYEDTRIKSPITGLIARKNIDFGTMVSIGTAAYRVVDISKLKLNISVPQEIINRVKVGGKAIIHLSALNGQTFNGTVKRISPQADASTGGFMIEIIVSNKENLIKAGMTAKVELLISKEQKVLAIPEYALVTKNAETYVYKVTGENAELVKVSVGESIGENIIVESGLNIGDKIVVVGMKNLGIKTKINVEKLH